MGPNGQQLVTSIFGKEFETVLEWPRGGVSWLTRETNCSDFLGVRRHCHWLQNFKKSGSKTHAGTFENFVYQPPFAPIGRL